MNQSCFIEMEQCQVCKGSGLVRQTAVVCEHPAVTFCSNCEMRGGFTVRPFEECTKCWGSGRVKPAKDDHVASPGTAREETHASPTAAKP